MCKYGRRSKVTLKHTRANKIPLACSSEKPACRVSTVLPVSNYNTWRNGELQYHRITSVIKVFLFNDRGGRGGGYKKDSPVSNLNY